jgi:hypothetical protein
LSRGLHRAEPCDQHERLELRERHSRIIAQRRGRKNRA